MRFVHVRKGAANVANITVGGFLCQNYFGAKMIMVFQYYR